MRYLGRDIAVQPSLDPQIAEIRGKSHTQYQISHRLILS